MNTVIFVLYVWTTVAMSGGDHNEHKAHDWRPIGEFRYPQTGRPALELCEDAAKQLGLNKDRYRCVRSQ